MLDLAILALRPNAHWILNGDTYEGLEWLDTAQQKPTPEEITQQLSLLEQQYSNSEYQRLRKEEYPSIADQLDLLYHGGYDTWKLAIQQIKLKYPKSEQ